MTHPIKRYCADRGLKSQKEFADLVGLSEGFVSQLVRGREVCGRSAALKINAATNGAIGVVELLTWKAIEAA